MLPGTVCALVVGGGPAGLSAATWLGRYRRPTLVVDAGEQRNLAADRAHGLLGRDPTTPRQLLADARAGLAQYPHVRLHHGCVTALRRDEDGVFRAEVDGREVAAERVVLTTGVRDRLPDLDGLAAHYGTDVHHCPACDGPTARDRAVVVLGSGVQLPGYAAELLDWAAPVRLVLDPAEPGIDDGQRAALADHGVEVLEGTAVALTGEPGDLRGVRLADGRTVPAAKVFFSYAHLPAGDLARQLGCALDHEGLITVDGFQLTSVDGVYAAGDVTPGLQLVPIAVGEGAAAGVACATSLRGRPALGGAPAPGPPTRRFAPG